jgi:hypothetical protein
VRDRGYELLVNALTFHWEENIKNWKRNDPLSNDILYTQRTPPSWRLEPSIRMGETAKTISHEKINDFLRWEDARYERFP